MESCPVKSVIAGGMGFALGGAFGLFMSSVCVHLQASLAAPSYRPNMFKSFANLTSMQISYDTPLSPQGQQLASLPMREQLRRGFKDMGSRSYSSAKNFALVGAIFSGTECCIEGVRSMALVWNGCQLSPSHCSFEQRTTLSTALPLDASPAVRWEREQDRKPQPSAVRDLQHSAQQSTTTCECHLIDGKHGALLSNYVQHIILKSKHKSGTSG